MRKKDLENTLIALEQNINFIKESIIDLKNQQKEDRDSHKDIYKMIESNYKEDNDKFATKEEVKEVWSTLKTLIYTSVSQVIAIFLMIIFKLWK